MPPKFTNSKSAHCISNSASQVVTINGRKTLRRSFRECSNKSKLKNMYTPTHASPSINISPSTQITPSIQGTNNNNFPQIIVKNDNKLTRNMIFVDVNDDGMELEFDIENSPSFDKDIETSKRLEPPIELKHNKSNSMPVDIDEYILENGKVDIQQILKEFNILSKYGFCDAVKK